jgi:hypothetical protein
MTMASADVSWRRTHSSTTPETAGNIVLCFVVPYRSGASRSSQADKFGCASAAKSGLVSGETPDA